LNAIQALSQLSYGPGLLTVSRDAGALTSIAIRKRS